MSVTKNKLHHTCVLMATKLEAQVFSERLGLEYISDQFEHAIHDKFSIVIGGMGKVNAACATLWSINQGANRIINVGIAGALNESLQLFGTYQPSIVKDLDLIDFSMPQLITGDSLLSLGSVGSPLKGGQLRDQFVGQVDLIDMEGYAVAKVSEQLGASVEFIKIVSDYCLKNSSEEISKNLTKLSKILAEELILFLNM